MNLDWMDNANCNPNNGDLFFPNESGNGSVKQRAEAESICHPCPVQAPCREFKRRTKTVDHGGPQKLKGKKR